MQPLAGIGTRKGLTTTGWFTLQQLADQEVIQPLDGGAVGFDSLDRYVTTVARKQKLKGSKKHE